MAYTDLLALKLTMGILNEEIGSSRTYFSFEALLNTCKYCNKHVFIFIFVFKYSN